MADRTKLILSFGSNGDIEVECKSYSLTWNLFNACASFEADIDPTLFQGSIITLSAGHNQSGQTAVGSAEPLNFTWKINDIPAMTGFVDSSLRAYSKTNYTHRLKGRDMMQVLVDNYIHKTNIYTNKTITYLINQIWVDNNRITSIKTINSSGTGYTTKTLSTALQLPALTFVYTDEANRLLTQFGTISEYKSEPGQTLFEYMSTLLAAVGCYMYNQPGTTNIIIAAVNTGKDKSYNPDGSLNTESPYNIIASRNDPWCNVIEASTEENVENQYSFIRLFGDASIEGGQEEQYQAIKNTYKIEKYITNFPQKFLVENVNTIDAKIWTKAQTQIINNNYLHMRRSYLNLKYTLPEHSPTGNSLYYINHTASVQDEFYTDVGFYQEATITTPEGVPTGELPRQNYLVIAVTFNGSKISGRTTQLQLMPSGFEYIDGSKIQ